MTGPYRMTGPQPDEDVELVPGDPALPDAQPKPGPEDDPADDDEDPEADDEET